MLTGVVTESSPNRNEVWLSEDVWRTGGSRVGVPALLRGLEKLNEGRGRPEASELMEGDRCAKPRLGESAPLLVENFLGPCECIDVLNELSPSPSVDSSDDMTLEDRLENDGRGGRSPVASNEFILVGFSGELTIEYVDTGDCCGRLSCVADRESCNFSSCSVGRLGAPLSMGVGDCSLLAPIPK